MTKPADSSLRTVNDLMVEFNVGKRFVLDALGTLDPVYTRPSGRGLWAFYSAGEADAAMRAHIEKKRKVNAPEVLSAHIVQQVDLFPVLAQLGSMYAAIESIQDQLVRLRADMLGRLDVIALREELEAILRDRDDAPARER
jgi:hypothetical protein